MAREFPRSFRVAEQLHRELAVLLRDAVHDPRIGEVTLFEVEVSPDLGVAWVYYACSRRHPEPNTVQQGLESAGRFLRRELGRRLHIRYVPQLRFVYDQAVDRGEYLDALIEQARARDRDLARDDEFGEGNADE